MNIPICRLIFFSMLLAIPGGALSAEISVDSTTILRMEQRDVGGTSKQDVFPATQFLGIDVDHLADGNLSLHLYGWGRADLADKSFNNDRINGSLTYGYLQYRFREANADIRAGRFFVHEGIVNEQVDGVSVRSDLPFGFGLSAFGGATVHTRHLSGEGRDGKGDGLYGGRGSYRYKGMLELGLSGVYESKAPTLASHVNGNHRLLGGDLWIRPIKQAEIIGHSSYNPETKSAAEHSYLLNVRPARGLVLSFDFNKQHDRSYQYAWSLFSGSALNPNDRSRSMGGRASYSINKAVEVSADYKHYTREIGNADRFGADAKLTFLNNSLRGGIGYHFLRAGSGFAFGINPSASYHELRAYMLYDSKSCFASADIIDYIFKERINGENNAWEGTLSLGYHITPDLALSGDISYGRNPQFTEETKGLIRLVYSMTYGGKGANK